MKITTDTNILISAAFWNGDSNRIIEEVEKGKIELFLSKEIIKEFMTVLNSKEIQDKIKNRNLEMKRTIEKVISISQIVEASLKLDIITEDKDDNKILECAKEGGVNFIISKDNHILKIKEFDKIKIITPEYFLNNIYSISKN